VNSVDKATQTQLANIQSKTGKTLDQLYGVIRESGFTKHGDIRDMLKKSLGLGHGDANALGLAYKKTLEAPQPENNDVQDDIYVGPKAGLRAIHERLMTEIAGLGSFEISPKKGYVSLRRKKQFAMVGPGTKQRLEVGLNMKGVKASDRLQEVPAGGMCQFKVFLSSVDEVDRELMEWVRQAYDSAG
jgi:predicted transport protein